MIIVLQIVCRITAKDKKKEIGDYQKSSRNDCFFGNFPMEIDALLETTDLL